MNEIVSRARTAILISDLISLGFAFRMPFISV